MDKASEQRGIKNMLLGLNLLFVMKVDKASELERYKEYAARIKPLICYKGG